MGKETYKRVIFLSVIQVILSIINTVIAITTHDFEIEYYIMFLLYCLSCSVIFLMVSEIYDNTK